MRAIARSKIARSKGVRLAGVFLLIAITLAGTLAFQVMRSNAAGNGRVMPNSYSEMDCNGWSPKYHSIKPFQRMLCTDPLAFVNGKATRFVDNGWYVGHDEPSLKFISSAAGSGNHMTYFMQLSTDPKGKPTTSPTGKTVSDYAELSPAPWFGLPICDNLSYPFNPCTPDSDSNTGSGLPTDAGSAFMELQFYPPGYPPFLDAPSCDATHWCAALNIDSLSLNGNCFEPVNFAFIQRNGVPAGPPSPQLTNVDTYTFNHETLLMNPGDTLSVTIQDTPHGLKTSIFDLSTGQFGFMVASAANGFMQTSPADCSGTPFNFHAEYSSAKQQNQVPWAALEGGVLMEDEIGHFEPCASLTNLLGFGFSGGGQSFSDPHMYQTCNGPFEAHSGGTGEGPCDFTTFTCANATTEGGAACPSNSLFSGDLCEFSDASCFPAGSRTLDSNGNVENVSWPVAGCEANFTQNGDLDFDGSPYIADWPDGSKNHPTSFQYIGPFDRHGHLYPSIQFETDAAASEANCNTVTGAGCAVPPTGAAFYPFWTLGAFCQWNFGNTIAHQTINSFGGAAEYGTPDVARYAGTLTSAVMANPEASGRCDR